LLQIPQVLTFLTLKDNIVLGIHVVIDFTECSCGSRWEKWLHWCLSVMVGSGIVSWNSEELCSAQHTLFCVILKTTLWQSLISRIAL